MPTLNPVFSSRPYMPEPIWQARQAFFERGVAPSGLVADAVLRSWQRCQRTGRTAAERVAFEPVGSSAALTQLLEPHQRLLQAAAPHLEALALALASAGYVAMLTDAQGRVLHTSGSLTGLGETFQAAFRPGVNLSEEAIGTTAMTTAIAEQAPCRVLGAEHFFAAAHSFHCCAAPVFSPQGEVIAAVDASRERPGHVPGALTLTQQCARRIEQALWTTLQAPVHLALHGVQPGGAAYLAFAQDGGLLAANRQACELFDLPSAPSTRELHFCDLFEDRFTPLLTRVRRGGGPLDLRLHGGVRLRAELGGRASVADKLPTHPALHDTPASPPATAAMPATEPDTDPAQQQRLRTALRAYEAGLPLLIQGETGTGKEHAARWLHQRSSRRHGPFVALNCAALSAQLMASELFGHAEGAFTGARRGGQAGHVEAAHGGTLLLDEIGDMPLDIQVALLRLLDRSEVTRLGETRPRPVDVRILCATHRDLPALVAQGSFRADLYHRLRGCLLSLPPLRERADFDALLHALLLDMQADPAQLPAPLRLRLRQQPWPGNVRQLRHTLRLAQALAEPGALWRWEDFQLDGAAEAMPRTAGSGQVMSTAVAPITVVAEIAPRRRASAIKLLPAQRQAAIQQTLAQTQGNMTEAARLLGIGRATLYRWLEPVSPAL